MPPTETMAFLMDRPEIFSSDFTAAEIVLKAGDVAPSDSLGFFLSGRQYVQRAVLFSLNDNSPH